uniref:Uncharacterized protein n=1 Tax=Romanomermis culicivorax TaxID=13658 RepID=A0A915K5Y9_ROMCU
MRVTITMTVYWEIIEKTLKFIHCDVDVVFRTADTPAIVAAVVIAAAEFTKIVVTVAAATAVVELVAGVGRNLLHWRDRSSYCSLYSANPLPALEI